MTQLVNYATAIEPVVTRNKYKYTLRLHLDTTPHSSSALAFISWPLFCFLLVLGFVFFFTRGDPRPLLSALLDDTTDTTFFALTRCHRSVSRGSSKCVIKSFTSAMETAPSPSTSKQRTMASASCVGDRDSVCFTSAAVTSLVNSKPSLSLSRSVKQACSRSSLHLLRARCFTTRILNGMPSDPEIADGDAEGEEFSEEREPGGNASSKRVCVSLAEGLLALPHKTLEIFRPISRNAGMSSAPSNNPAQVTTRYVPFGSKARPLTVSSEKQVSLFRETETPSSHCKYPPQDPPSLDFLICSASENATALASSWPIISSVIMLFSKGTSVTKSPYVSASLP